MLFLFAAIFTSTPLVTYAADRQLRQQHSIHITVDCLYAAMDAVNDLPGHNLDSSANLGVRSRTATFRRRIDTEYFRYVQDILRTLGDVEWEAESAAHLAASMLDLDVRIAVLDQELERLTAMMEDSDTLNVLIAVNARITDVSRDRESLVGQRNVLIVDAGSAILNITLSEIPPEPVPTAPVGFWQRMRDNFMNSARNSRDGAESFLLAVVRLALPVITWGVILCAIGFAAWKLVLRKLPPIRFRRSGNKETEVEEVTE